MKYRFFTIPANAPDEAQEELNRFCAAQRVVSLDKQFVQDAARSYWALCVGYVDGQGTATPAATSQKGKIDYREVLNEQDFAVFAKLRSLRKELADKEGLPAYAVLTNEQMAELVKRRVITEAAMREIAGIGDARIKKYGKAFLYILQEAIPKLAAATPAEPF